MQTVLILGATSSIGAALSEQFANENRVILSARNQDRLSAISARCLKAGAVAVRIAATDLAQTIQPIIDANSEWPIDLIIDAASAASGASRVRDPDIAPETIRRIIQADVLSHLDLYHHLARLNGKHSDVVFISTVLAIVKTPEREIYSATKRLIEIYLEKIRSAESNTKVLIFRVGKRIDPTQDSLEAKAMAGRVQQALSAGRLSVLYGIGGHIIIGLNSLHPVVLRIIVRIQRFVTRRRIPESSSK